MTQKLNLKKLIAELWPETERFLCDLIKIPSLSGHENEAICFLFDQFDEFSVDAEKVKFPDAIVEDPEYNYTYEKTDWNDKYNLRIVKPGSGCSKSLLLNTHVDVVPPSENDKNPWVPAIIDGTIYARGACDAKGQIACIYLVFKILENLNRTLSRDIVAHLVIEEEISSNGSLVMTRIGEKADACIVLEPTNLNVINAIRGAVWFKILFTGKSGHSGNAVNTRSALKMACHAMNVLEEYHDQLLNLSKGSDYFNKFINPMPLTFGKLQAGNWPASIPSKAVLEGVLAFLPNKNKEQICEELKKTLLSDEDKYFANNHQLLFTLRKSCSVVEAIHHLPQALLASARAAGINSLIDAANCSSDAWVYTNLLNIPTVQFGPGDLSVCHGENESIKIEEIQKAAEILTLFIVNYCGAQ